AEDGIRDFHVTGVQTCALPICGSWVTLAINELGSIASSSSPWTAVTGTGVSMPEVKRREPVTTIVWSPVPVPAAPPVGSSWASAGEADRASTAALTPAVHPRRKRARSEMTIEDMKNPPFAPFVEEVVRADRESNASRSDDM